MPTTTRPNWLVAILGVILALTLSAPQLTAQSPTPPQQNAAPKIKWQPGPFKAKLGEYAEIQVPKDFIFTDGDGARQYMELAHNPVSHKEVGILTPKAEDQNWFVLFEFDDIGYVKDDEGSSLDANAILTSLKEGTEDANVIRKQKGWSPFHITGWQTLPFYDPVTHNLTWAIHGEDELAPGAKNDGSNQSVNYSVRVLGRRGTMNIDLILDPKDVNQTVPVFKSLMSNFNFVDGHRYADFTTGDRLAEYGLTALIAGGVGAAAAKTGLLAKFWKLIVGLFVALWKVFAVIFAAIVARFKQILAWFKGLFRKKNREEDAWYTPQIGPGPNDNAGD